MLLRSGVLLFATLFGFGAASSSVELACSESGECAESGGRSLLQLTSEEDAQDLFAAEKEEEHLQKEEEQEHLLQDRKEQRQGRDEGHEESGVELEQNLQDNDRNFDDAVKRKKGQTTTGHCLCGKGEFVGVNKLWSWGRRNTTCQDRVEAYCKRKRAPRWMKVRCCNFKSKCDISKKAKQVCDGQKFLGKNMLNRHGSCQKQLDATCRPWASKRPWPKWMKSKCCDYPGSDGSCLCGKRKFLADKKPSRYGRRTCGIQLSHICQRYPVRGKMFVASKCCEFEPSCLCKSGAKFIGSNTIYRYKCEDKLGSVCAGPWSKYMSLVKKTERSCCLPAATTTITSTSTTTSTTTTSTTTTTTTLHPCDDGSHGCDAQFGICVKQQASWSESLFGSQNASWSCSCAAGYECVAGCEDPKATHKCAATTTTKTMTTSTTTTSTTENSLYGGGGDDDSQYGGGDDDDSQYGGSAGETAEESEAEAAEDRNEREEVAEEAAEGEAAVK